MGSRGLLVILRHLILRGTKMGPYLQELLFLAFSQLCAASFLRRSTRAECANTCIQLFHGLFGYWPVKEGILFKNNGVAVKQSTYVTGRAEVVLLRL